MRSIRCRESGGFLWSAVHNFPMKKQTYVLFVPGKRPPTVYHNSIETAREEAQRLLAQDENKSVMICEFIEGLEKVVKHKALMKNSLTDRDEAVPF